MIARFASPAFSPSPVIRTDGKAIVLDLSKGSMALGESLQNIAIGRFSELVEQAMAGANTTFAFGRYGEERELYQNKNFYDADSFERRSIHLGIDLFCATNTPVMSPLDAEVAIIANNKAELDYGPMLILRHDTKTSEVFYTLYGHLCLKSLADLAVGQVIAAGEQIAAVGSPPENGNWPPHLHFQIILDLLDLGADFPGVAYPGQRDAWQALSPSPAVFFPECDPTWLNCELAD